jgi:hypothetical protein
MKPQWQLVNSQNVHHHNFIGPGYRTPAQSTRRHVRVRIEAYILKKLGVSIKQEVNCELCIAFRTLNSLHVSRNAQHFLATKQCENTELVI